MYVSKEVIPFKHFWIKANLIQKSFKIAHTIEGLSSLVAFLEDVKEESGQKPSVVLESTGHYQAPVVHYLEERGYDLFNRLWLLQISP